MHTLTGAIPSLTCRTSTLGPWLEFPVCHARVPSVERELEATGRHSTYGNHQGGSDRRPNHSEYGSELCATGTVTGRCHDGLWVGGEYLQYGETLQPSLLVRERGQGEFSQRERCIGLGSGGKFCEKDGPLISRKTFRYFFFV